MTILDKFRTQPRDKHPDAAVRLAYVEELPLVEREAIAAIAKEDEDPRVRKAAVSKLMDPAALGRIAAADADDTVRAAASTMLRDLALDAFEGVSESDGLDAVDAICDARVLAQVAKSSARDVIALKAIERLASENGAADAKPFGSVARHAATEAARRAAFEHARRDHREVIDTAMNGEFKDTSVAAVDLIADHAELEQIAERSKSKPAAKRARGILREAAERETAEARAAEEQRKAEADALAAASAIVVETAAADAGATRVAPVPAEIAPIDPEEERARSEAQARERAEADMRAQEAADEAARKETERREAKDAADRTRRESLARVHSLLGRVEPLAAKADLSLKAAERALRDVRAALADVPPLPSRQDFEDVSGRLKAAQSALSDKTHELKTAAEWRQWANAGVQEQLCVKMEALKAVEDPEAIAAEVKTLQQQWKQAADVPRAQADALWRRFKAAHDEVWSRCEASFAAEAKARTDSLAKKVALCDKAEALQESTSWIQTADAIKALQAEWKTIGPVSRGREKQIWDRFRAACDRFFSRRHEDLAQRKTAWSENFAKKEALCVRVEALVESTDWDATAAEIKRIQQEWKTIGAVKQSRSEAIWQRFRAACDAFFARYAQRHETARVERVQAREAICVELEAIGAAPADDVRTPQEILTAVRALRGQWQQELGLRGVDPQRARELDDRAAAAFAAILARWPNGFAGTDLDPEANRKRMETLVKKVEDLAGSLTGHGASSLNENLSPAARMAAMLKDALAANTIGGKVDDGAKWRAAADEVRQAQASWSRIGAVPDAARKTLTDRFDRACRRITERSGKSGGSRP
ncbi:MAG TPA: DUF349 domain-containing protein [Vicinamibacterales bacterium]|jgi:hypothetical protein|nr:DUF349 domain-containing protein [Vicinamibacterales bacterium]